MIYKGGMMKKLLLLGLLSVLLVAFCGAPPEGETEVPTKGVDVAYGKLTEGELQKFMKVFPVAKDEIEKSGKEFESNNDNIESWIGQFATVNKEVAGLDAKLSAAGMAWNEFWPAFAKTWTASIAVMMTKEMGEMEEGMAEIKKQLNDPKIPDAQKEMMKAALGAMEEMKKIADKVPQENKDVVKKHWDELTKLFEMD
jgi:methyl-accepting chemotaxis protein